MNQIKWTLVVCFGILVAAPDASTQQEDGQAAAGTKLCATLAGVWKNQLGSELTLRVAGQGELAGTYVSAVALDPKDSSANDTRTTSQLTGNLRGTVTSSGLLAFHVPWNNGTAVTSWTGQCEACDGKEVLFSTWVLTEKKRFCGDNWKANRIGQDIFKRG